MSELWLSADDEILVKNSEAHAWQTLDLTRIIRNQAKELRAARDLNLTLNKRIFDLEDKIEEMNERDE